MITATSRDDCRQLLEEAADALRPVAALIDLAAAARRLSENPALLQARLRSLRAQPERLAELADRSYWHSNGFAKIRLVEHSGFCVRLHVWPTGGIRQSDVNPHGHRWDFASWVVAGQGVGETYFDEVPWAATDVNGASVYVRCDYGPSRGRRRLRARGTAWLRGHEELSRPVGTVYTCTTDVVHTVRPIGRDLVATLVLQGPALTESTRVFLDPDRVPDSEGQPISIAQLHDLLADVDLAITKAGTAKRFSIAHRERSVERRPAPPLRRRTFVPSSSSSVPSYNLLDWLLTPLLGSGRDLANIRQATEALRDHPAFLRSSLNVLQHDSDGLAAVAKRSSIHPNGFAKIVLSRGEGWALRLHVWSPRIRPDGDDGEPHGHRWEFASWIITGVLRETRFDVAHHGGPFHRYVYRGSSVEEQAGVQATGTAALVEVEEIDRVAGTVYERTGSEVHTAAPCTDLVATLVLHGHSADITQVYRLPGERPGRDEPLSVETLRVLLGEVTAALQ